MTVVLRPVRATPRGRSVSGVVSMLVGGVSVPGVSGSLGRCPGSVPVELRGLAGSSSTVYELCN